MTSDDASPAEVASSPENGARWRSRIVGHTTANPKDLIPHPLNWRGHPGYQASALAGVLDDVGWVQSVVVNRTTGRLVDGHLRVELAKRRGELEIPIVEVELSEAEETLILATLDPIAAMAKAHGDRLRAVLESIHSPNTDVQALVEDIAHRNAIDLFVRPGEEEAPSPEPPEESSIERGQIIELGPHRLMCGDSGNPADVDLLLAGEPIHLVNTDPPYNVNVEPRSNNAIAAGLSEAFGPSTRPKARQKAIEASDRAGMHHQGFDLARHKSKSKPTGKKMRPKDRPLINDFVSPEQFEEMLLAWFGNMARVLIAGRSFYIWGGYANCANYPPALKASKLYFSQAIIWIKEHPVLTRKDFMGNHEWCFYGWREGAGHYFAPGKNNATDVWSVKKINPQAMVHLTEKPVELAVRAMEYSSRPGEHVLDLFGGSGSTLMGAEKTGRRAFLMEMDPLYCQVIVDRYEAAQAKAV
jgi:DNA modification methylase